MLVARWRDGGGEMVRGECRSMWRLVVRVGGGSYSEHSGGKLLWRAERREVWILGVGMTRALEMRPLCYF